MNFPNCDSGCMADPIESLLRRFGVAFKIGEGGVASSSVGCAVCVFASFSFASFIP